MAAAHIVSRKNGVGLDRDVAILEQLLESQLTVQHHGRKSLDGLPGWNTWRSSERKRQSDLYLMVERIPWRWSRAPGMRMLIPNQERFPERHLGRLSRQDLVLCKTRHAVDVFSHYCRSEFVGFTSPDRNLPGVDADYGRFFHLAGRSTMKGTETLINVWSDHPEWPTLTIVQDPRNTGGTVPPNVDRISRRLSEPELLRLQNEHGVHLCPSRSEGWGHSIVEGMSCGAVVVTTDGPPMNELISDERGVLVPFERSSPRHLGTCFDVAPQGLEDAVQALVDSSVMHKRSLGLAARDWYEQNDLAFRKRFVELIDSEFVRGWHADGSTCRGEATRNRSEATAARSMASA